MCVSSWLKCQFVILNASMLVKAVKPLAYWQGWAWKWMAVNQFSTCSSLKLPVKAPILHWAHKAFVFGWFFVLAPLFVFTGWGNDLICWHLWKRWTLYPCLFKWYTGENGIPGADGHLNLTAAVLGLLKRLPFSAISGYNFNTCIMEIREVDLCTHTLWTSDMADVDVSQNCQMKPTRVLCRHSPEHCLHMCRLLSHMYNLALGVFWQMSCFECLEERKYKQKVD